MIIKYFIYICDVFKIWKVSPVKDQFKVSIKIYNYGKD
jgi:hypothetical protein